MEDWYKVQLDFRKNDKTVKINDNKGKGSIYILWYCILI